MIHAKYVKEKYMIMRGVSTKTKVRYLKFYYTCVIVIQISKLIYIIRIINI